MATKTERVDQAAEDVLQGGTKDLELNPAEQALYAELIGKIRHGELEADGDLWRLDYVRQPPTIEEFIFDEYFLGRTLKPVPGENEGMWPGWMALLKADFDLDSCIHNAVITGSLGVGKTYCLVILLLYRICVATHLRNPQNFFGIARSSRIVYNFLSVTKESVRDTAFGDAMNFMAESPYFLEVCRYNPDLDYSAFRIQMKNSLQDNRLSNIWITAGSKGQHLLGRNVVGVGLDEGNFRLEKDPDMKAYALYDAVRTRIANRFQKLSTFLPALSIIASSAADESSFTEKVITEINEQNERRQTHNRQHPDRPLPRTQLVYRNAVYRIKRHALQDIGPDHRWFKVTYGLKNMEPYILAGWYREDGSALGAGPHEEAPKGAMTELVPEFYHEAFRRNCRTNLQALSGISVSGAHRLFSSMVDVEWCLAQSELTGVPNNVMPGVERMSISQEDDRNIWDFLIHKKFVTRVASRYQPVRHPERLRYCHIDLATQSLAGVSICHLVGAQVVEGLVRDGKPFSEYRLIVEYDFILTICAGATKPISIEKIQNFIFWLRDMCGFRFGKVTADIFQSDQMLQSLEAKGVPVDKLSLDRDKTVYLNWRTGFEDRRIRLPRNQQMLREAEALLELDRKFDHPGDGAGSKDTCLSLKEVILLADGRAVVLGHLVKGQRLLVLGMQAGRLVAAQAEALGVTLKAVPTVRVHLNNGSSVECTPDHLFLLPDGSYARADRLQPETLLMTLHYPEEWSEPFPSDMRVMRVEDVGIQDVGCLRTDTGNFALACGIFVHNSDSAAGAYYDAITSDETAILSSYNAPTVITSQQETPAEAQGPVVTIPTPPKTYTRLKKYEA